MEYSWCVAIFLGLLLVWRDLYWSKQVNKLIDKLMSRDFESYTKAGQTPEKIYRIREPEDGPDYEIDRISEVGQI